MARETRCSGRYAVYRNERRTDVRDGHTFDGPQYPMNTWPVRIQMANLCTPAGAPTTCNGTQLDAIAASMAKLSSMMSLQSTIANPADELPGSSFSFCAGYSI